MTIRNLATLIEKQFPSFVKEEGPRLIAFLKAYYEWVDANQIDLESTSDIDTTLDGFLDHFKTAVMQSIPASIVVDERRLMKHIKDLWMSKGNEKSIALLFRILFDEDIEIYYPREDILRASDGRWSAETSIRISAPFTGDVTSLGGQLVVGQTNSGSGRVERVVSTVERGIQVYELYLSNVNGTFETNEVVTNAIGDISGVCFTVVGPASSISITRGGAYHEIGDSVNLVQVGGAQGTAIVTEVTDRSAVLFTLTDGGSGYRVGHTVTSIEDGSGSGASFAVTAVNNTESINLNTDEIEPMALVPINTGPTFVSGGANTSIVLASLAAANVSSTLSSAFTFDSVTVGSIFTISQTHGNGYSTLPTAAIAEDIDVAAAGIPDGSGGIKGYNAVIDISRAPGSITKATIVTPGQSYSTIETLSLTNTTRGNTEDATAIAKVDAVTNYPGRYLDTKGWLSWNNKLQDNEYYQSFSYVIKSTQFVNDYREIIRRTVHPAGTAMFGEYSIRSSVVLPSITVSSDMNTAINGGAVSINTPVVINDELQRIWVEIHNSDFIYKAKDIVLNTDPFGALGANSAIITSAFANANVSTQLEVALTFPTYFHDLAEGSGVISIKTGSSTVTGVGTSFSTLLNPPANTYIVLDNTPSASNTVSAMYQVIAVANNTSMTINDPFNHPSIVGDRFTYYSY